MEPRLDCLLAWGPWDWDPEGRRREAGGSVGAGVKLDPGGSMGRC